MQWQHAAEIRQVYRYTYFSDEQAQQGLREFVAARAFTHAEGPTALFEQAVAWLPARRVLLPGVSVLVRFVAHVRDQATEALWRSVAEAAERADTGLPARLAGLLTVPEGQRVSELERLRRAPARMLGPEMVRALDRAAEVPGIGAGRVDLAGIPTSRLGALARYGLVTKAPTLRDLSPNRQTATVLATVRHLEAAAVDDALDLFSVLMATRLLNRAQRAGERQRLAELPRLTGALVGFADDRLGGPGTGEEDVHPRFQGQPEHGAARFQVVGVELDTQLLGDLAGGAGGGGLPEVDVPDRAYATLPAAARTAPGEVHAVA
jgi:Domain of unknown function (DUF4158)